MPHPQIPDTLAQRLNGKLESQEAFKWTKEPWIRAVEDAPEVVATLEALPETLDREVVRKIVQEKLAKDQVLGAFIPVLIWGGPGGYGPFRARSILTGIRKRENINAAIDPTVSQKLREGAIAAQKDDALEAFRLMNNEKKVKYLGGAFFTKWLYFASMKDALDGSEAAPILDARVSSWIARNTEDQGAIRLKPRSTRSYESYLELLDAWGAPYNRTRAQVELAIFELSVSR
ncbi:8-oxoguanine DNA glycosylase OGG fold protein [Citricoccus sp. NR2]|uniref:8-oxoguanine DNA glycosylase OGG fold protein n=1 Tax=Citricoccus sp. NR2 TaxID=3004095 RepID=UPI0022DD5CD6|nr:hypothetical protein [Citricoccus sp. NR2]WBL19799.1 hypothetical protein O1A05_03645 [Citricoccus sp. NR2]